MATYINLPKCNWCKSAKGNIFKCKDCRQYTCDFCLVDINQSGRCLHKKYEPIKSTGWKDD